MFAAATEDKPGLRVSIAHANAPEWVDVLTDLAQRTRPQAEIELVRILGAVVGTHAGPGAVGFFWLQDPSGLRQTGRRSYTRRRASRSVPYPAAGRFAGVDPPAAWPRTRSAPHPEALEASVETLPGVGPTAARRLARLGLRTVGDVLAHRPRRYERPAPERTISELFGDEEAVIEVVVRRASGRRRGRLHILTAHVADDTGEIRATWFNQPWLETKLTAGRPRPSARPSEPVRLRGRVVRPRRCRRHGRLRARVPVHRGPRPEAAALDQRGCSRRGGRRR